MHYASINFIIIEVRRDKGKSHCPINFTLEIVGDQWSLLIMRDILLYDKRRYKDFLQSAEKISTNILASRLLELEKHGIIEKMCEQYFPTQKGLALLPLLIEVAAWGAKHDPETSVSKWFVKAVKNDSLEKNKRIKQLMRLAKTKG